MPNTNAMDVSSTTLHLHGYVAGLPSASSFMGLWGSISFVFPNPFKMNKIVHLIRRRTGCKPTFFALQLRLVLITSLIQIRSMLTSRGQEGHNFCALCFVTCSLVSKYTSFWQSTINMHNKIYVI